MNYQELREALLEKLDSYGYRMEQALRNSRSRWEPDPDMTNRYRGQAEGWGKITPGLNRALLNGAADHDNLAKYLKVELDQVLRLRAATKEWYEKAPQDRERLWLALGEIEAFNTAKEDYEELLKGEN